MDRFCFDNNLGTFIDKEEKIVIAEHLYRLWLYRQGAMLIVKPAFTNYKQPQLLSAIMNYVPVQFERILFRMTGVCKHLRYREVKYIEITLDEFRVKLI